MSSERLLLVMLKLMLSQCMSYIVYSCVLFGSVQIVIIVKMIGSVIFVLCCVRFLPDLESPLAQAEDPAL